MISMGLWRPVALAFAFVSMVAAVAIAANWTATVAAVGSVPTVETTGKASDNETALQFGCRPDFGPTVSMLIYNYPGDALAVGGAQTIVDLIIDGNGFRTFVYHVEGEDAWVNPNGLGADFLDAFAAGNQMLAQTVGGEIVATFGLGGTRVVRETIRQTCGF